MPLLQQRSTHLLALLLAALQLAAPASATLAVVVPSRDGLVVAADSRLTFRGAECDGAFKILEPARPERTVAIVTGDTIFVAPPPPGQEPCSYLATAPRLLDVGAVVTSYLDRSGGARGVSANQLAGACVRAVERFRARYPAALRGYAGKDIFSVVVASYDAADAQSTLINFVVRLDARTHRVEAARRTTTILNPRSPRGVWIYGETAYADREVYAGVGRRFLDRATIDFLDVREPIADVSTESAVAVAGNVIQAASRAARLVPAPSGIGGPIRVVVLNSDARPAPPR